MNSSITQRTLLELLNLAGKQRRAIVAVDLPNQRVVVKSLQVQFGGFRHGGLFEHDFDSVRIDGHIFVPDLDTFLVAFLEKFGVRDLGVLRIDFHGEGGVVDGSFHAIEVSHQEYLERVWILLHKRAGETGPWPDHPKSLFEIVDNDRKTFTARDFALWRGYNQPVGIA